MALLVTPRIIARTKEIERIIYTSESHQLITTKSTSQKDKPKTISNEIFFEKLAESIGEQQVNKFKEFAEELIEDLNIKIKLGRGNKISFNIKSPNEGYNFASVQESGEVWFYGLVTKAEEFGDRKIGENYLSKLAELVGGEVDDSYKEWSWTIKRDNNYLDITEYLEQKDQWKQLIADTLDALYKLEDT